MLTNLLGEGSSRNVLASCFCGAGTLLNTNGTLVKVVRLRNFRFSTSLMEKVHSVCQKILYSDEYDCAAVWVSMVRSPVSHSCAGAVATDEFASGFSKSYIKFLREQDKFSNEVFISVVSNSVLGCVVGCTDFLLSSLLKRFSKAISEVVDVRLKGAVEVLFADLAEYSPVLLNETELLHFLSDLLDVGKEGLGSGIKDIAEELLAGRSIFFGFNTFQISGETKSFGTSFSVKNFNNVRDLRHVSRLLELETKVIVTEVISKENEEGVKRTFGEGIELRAVIDDEVYQQASSKDVIAKFIQEKRFQEFCKRSLKVTLLSDSTDGLTSALAESEKIFSRRGCMIVQDDLLLEDTFWGKLPGSFSRMKQWETVLLRDVCFFGFTHSYFRGDVSKCFTQFLSVDGKSHYFSFFNSPGKGHALIVGKDESAKIELQNFLLLEASVNLGMDFLIIDDKSLSEVFVRAMGGSYIEVGGGVGKYNLLDVSDNKILCNILSEFCSGDVRGKDIEDAVENLSSIPPCERNMTNCARYLAPILGDLAVFEQNYGYLFDGDADNRWLLESGIGISFGKSLPSSVTPLLLSCVMSKYLEFRRQSNRPFIIAIQNPAQFKSLFSSLLECELFLRSVGECGGLVMLSSETVAFLKGLGKVGKECITTKMLVPLGEKLTAEQGELFGISSSAMYELNEASLSEKCFFLRQGEEAVTLKFDLSPFEEAKVLSSYGKSKKVKDIIREAGDNPAIWLPLFYRKCT